MPFSQSSQLSTIVQWVERMKPVSILDVGTGMGQYGILLRNNLENEHLFIVTPQSATQRPRDEWNIRIDGIEGFPGYLTPCHDWAYNRMMIGNALEILPGIATASYDVVLAIDVLEHFTPDDGQIFLAELRRIAKQGLLVSTPKDFHAQDIPANTYENHRSVWTREQLAASGLTLVLENEESWVVTNA
jgi:ubiquinone/menaquinone biosynthesis C-methylase UbiE